MNIGIIQISIGQTGGNDTVLRTIIDTLKNHDVTLFTFSKPSKDFSDVKVESKIPFKMPFLGIYKRFFMPKFDYSKMDLLISITGYCTFDTDKRLIVYDQNNLGPELLNKNISIKYQKGFWKYYYKPYKFLIKFQKPNLKAEYVANSFYSKDSLEKALNKKVGVVYPPVEIKKYTTSEKKKQVAMLCRLSPEKNMEFAINVLNKMDCRCIIIGAITPMTMGYFNKLQSLCKSNVIISPNISRDNLENILAESKVFFHTAPETFGISVIEGIASGCVPIVPDNSAHPETVPTQKLRYTPDDVNDAVARLNHALNGEYDMYIPSLKEHIKKFDTRIFQEEVQKWIE